MGLEDPMPDSGHDGPDLHDSYTPFKSRDFAKAPEFNLPEHKPKALTPPVGVTEKELFAFPGVNWFEYFRDSVLKVAYGHMVEAQQIMEPLKVEPGWFDLADSIRTFFNNFKGDTLNNLSVIEQALRALEGTLTDQAAKYRRLEDAVSESVSDLGIDFGRADAALEGFKQTSVMEKSPQPK